MKLSLWRRYWFPASHRLFREEWSPEENEKIFGKCANPQGHGHNYMLEVSVTGAVDPATGMIADLAELDRFVREKVLDAFDHANLNEEVGEFHQYVPTTENVCRVVFERLSGFPGARLEEVRIEETGKNSFQYAGPANSKGADSTRREPS